VIQKSPDWWVKIGDFGISKRVNEGNTALRSLFGSSGYMAPEMLEDTRHTRNFQYDEKVDMWSLGILVHYMITKTLPFDTDSKWKEYMKSSQFPSTKLATFKVSEECHNFIAKALLTRKAANRMSASNALQHQWLRHFNTANSNEQKIVAHENYELSTEKVDEKNIEIALDVASLSLNSTDASARWSAQTETESSIPVPQQAQECAIQEQTRAPAVEEGPSNFDTHQWTDSSSPVSENTPKKSTERVRRFEEEDAEDADWEGEGSRYWIDKKGLNKPKRKKAPKLSPPGSERNIQHSYEEDPMQNNTIITSVYDADRIPYPQTRSKNTDKDFYPEIEEGDAEDADWEGEGSRHWVDKKDLNRSNRNKAPKPPAPSEKHIAHSNRGDPAQNYAEIILLPEAGCAAYAEKRFEDAEKNFRQVLGIREVLLGPDHEDTIHVTHWLGVTTYHLKGKIEEAESLLRRALRGREKLHGNRHEKTMNTVFWLGRCLHIEEKYKEAEGLFQRALQGRKKLHGNGHTKTLDAAFWLGRCLWIEEKYKEAEVLLQRVLQGREKVLGFHDEETLDAAKSLGKSLYFQKNHKDAKELFERCEEGFEKLFGPEYEHTESARRWVGKATRKIRLENTSK
jgi:serine/threonine protein kinase